jgi:hypothetical protein
MSGAPRLEIAATTAPTEISVGTSSRGSGGSPTSAVALWAGSRFTVSPDGEEFWFVVRL